jgi:hypothetical protein
MSPLARLQKLLLCLSDNYSSYRLFLEQGEVPVTNSASKRAIGHWRIRSPSGHGFKTWAGLANPAGDNQGLVGGLPNSLISLEGQPVVLDDQGFQGRAVALGQQI